MGILMLEFCKIFFQLSKKQTYFRNCYQTKTFVKLLDSFHGVYIRFRLMQFNSTLECADDMNMCKRLCLNMCIMLCLKLALIDTRG